MNESLRWKIVLGCLLVAALEAPKASLLVAEDLGGPYAAEVPIAAHVPFCSTALIAALQRPMVDASLHVFGFGDPIRQPAYLSNPMESGRDFDSSTGRAGWFDRRAAQR